MDELMRVALGEKAPDLVLADATVLDAAGGGFLPHRSLWIAGGRIARVAGVDEPIPHGVGVREVSGLTLVPGLMDGHTHMAGMFTPELVRALLPTGVTSLVIESMEFSCTHGRAGIHPLIDSLPDQPLRLYYTAPAHCGLISDEEPAPLTADELAELLADPRCLGLGETYWNNALAEGPQGERARRQIAQTLAAGKVAEGHTAGARGARLDAYVGLGVSSCHEPISVAEALEVYHRGLLLMLRHGGIRRDLEALRPLFDLGLDPSRLALVTDSVDPERLATWGHLDQVVREALELGVAPHLVYRMTSLNVAEHFRLEHLHGSLAPGRYADLVAIPDPGDFRPVLVMVGGVPVFDHGQVLAGPRPVTVEDALLRTVGVDAEHALALVGPPPRPPATGSVRAIEHVSTLVTRETVLAADVAAAEDLVPVLALERTRGEEGFWGFLKGFGLREGAYVSTAVWDSPNLVVVGRDAVSVKTALRRVAELGGGLVYARGEEVVAEHAMPICACAPFGTLEQVGAERRKLEHCLSGAGVPWDDPLLAVDTLTTPAIPHLRLTHRGYLRLRDRALLPREEA